STALERLGHRVERIEVSGPASRTAARLEAYAPDLVFNTAEGRRGRFREAFYPALFDELGFPYTGSDAWVLAVTLDKALTKLVLREHGVVSPKGQFIEDISELKLEGWRFPVIVKPNFEGSSKGITQDSVVEDRQRLRARAQDMARRAYKALGVRDLGRIDFRVADDGQVYFIEINALPSLEPGAGIYAAAALEGLHTDAVLGKVVESAVARWGLKDPRRSGSRPPRRGPLRVGFTYNVK